MNTTIEIDLVPFSAPDYVNEKSYPDPTVAPTLGEPTRPGQEVKLTRQAIQLMLCDLDAETLDKMCDEFRKSVFKKAGKQPPPAVKIDIDLVPMAAEKHRPDYVRPVLEFLNTIYLDGAAPDERHANKLLSIVGLI